MKGEKLTRAQRKERRAQRRKGFWDNMREQYKKSKVLFLTYFVLRLIVNPYHDRAVFQPRLWKRVHVRLYPGAVHDSFLCRKEN